MTTDLVDAPAPIIATPETLSSESRQVPEPSTTTPLLRPDSPALSQQPIHDPTLPTATDDDDLDDADNRDAVTASLETDALDFNKATISIHLQLLPHDDHTEGRPVILGIRSHHLTPITMTIRAGSLLPLPQPIADLLEQWKGHYLNALDVRTTVRKQQLAKDKARQAKHEEERKRRREEQKQKPHKPKPQVPRDTKTTTPPKDNANTNTPLSLDQPQPQSLLF